MPVVRLRGTQIGAQPASAPLRPIVSDTSLVQAGAALGDLAGSVKRVADYEREQTESALFAEADRQLSDLATHVLHDPDNGALNRRESNALNLPDQYVPQLDRDIAEITDNIKSPRVRQAITARAMQMRSDVLLKTEIHESQERERWYDGAEEARLETSYQSAAHTPDARMSIEKELATQRTVIAGRANRKGWDESQTALAMREAETKTHAGVIGRLLVDNRHQTAGRYLAEHAGAMDDAVVEQLQRRVILEEDQAFGRTLRQRKLASDETSKDGIKLMMEGKLSAEWIEANRNRLDPEDYKYFYRGLSGEGEVPRDPMIYADLRERAGFGQDVRDEAREALRRGQINLSGFNNVVGETEQQRPSWYRRGSQFISTSAAVSDLNPDPASAQRKAAMLDDWDSWARSNPKAGDADAQQAYKRIVDEYALIDMNQIALVKRAPSFLAGSRTAPDLDATEDRTVDAFERGEIDQPEFNRQAALIQEWRRILAKQPKPKAPAK